MYNVISLQCVTNYKCKQISSRYITETWCVSHGFKLCTSDYPWAHTILKH